MKHKYVISVDGKGVDEMLKGVQEYKKWLARKTDELASKLADIGAVNASISFARAFYTGPNDTEVSVEKRGNGKYAVIANGEAVLFIEFGSGLIGYGHPEPQGYGPGTFPGKGHWDDPKGWYLPKGKWAADGTKHTYGNPPAMAMYNTVKELERELNRIAQEVFSN